MSSHPPGILYLDRVSLLGGAERILLQCMRVAGESGYRPVLACPGDGPLPDAARAAGFEVVPSRFNRMKGTSDPRVLAGYAADLWRENRRVLRACREHRIGLLHAHGPVSGLYGLSAARRLRIPMLVHVHDALEPRGQYRGVVRLLTPVTRRFVCVSHAAQDMLLRLGVPRDRTEVRYNGLDPAFTGPPPPPTPEVCGPGPHVGIFALIWPLKGQHVFLEAAERLTARFPTAHFYIVGSLAYPDDRPYLERLHALADAPPLAGRVTFPGYRHDVGAWMAAMDAVVLASVEPEALPSVVAEAMALGRRVVATDLGGTREIVTDGNTGRLVPPNDSEALARAVAEVLEAPDATMGERAAQDVRRRFSPEAFAAGLRHLYAGLLPPLSDSSP